MNGLIEMVFFGQHASGKTALIQKRFTPLKDTTHPLPTMVVQYKREINQDGLTIHYWDLSGKTCSQSLATVFYKCASIGIYCIDLSMPLDVPRIQSDIDTYKKINHHGIVVLVGTKADSASKKDNEAFNQLTLTTPVHSKRFITSALTNEGIESLFKEVNIIAKYLITMSDSKTEQSNPASTITPSVKNETKPELNSHERMIIALEELESTGALYAAIITMDKVIIPLTQEKKAVISQEITTLINALLDENMPDKIEAIATFQSHCQQQIKSAYFGLIIAGKLIIDICIAATMAVLTGLGAFFIGFAAGIWSGPGAFISALISGETAAVVSIVSSGIAMVGAGGLSAFGLFRPNSTSNALKAITTCAKETYTPNL